MMTPRVSPSTNTCSSVRADAPWCPSNIEFIRRINGLDSVEDVKKIVFEASYLVMGLGDVYLGAPVATPVDPRHRLITTKYNPGANLDPGERGRQSCGAYLCIYENGGSRRLPIRRTHLSNVEHLQGHPGVRLRPALAAAFFRSNSLLSHGSGRASGFSRGLPSRSRAPGGRGRLLPASGSSAFPHGKCGGYRREQAAPTDGLRGRAPPLGAERPDWIQGNPAGGPSRCSRRRRSIRTASRFRARSQAASGASRSPQGSTFRAAIRW